MEFLPPTQRRVEFNTAQEINERNQAQIRRNVECFADATPEVITQRIHQLESEWDIERVLEANASALALGSVILSVVHSRKWLFLTGTVAGFLLQHALQGWCPPVPIFRKRGVRTSAEIYQEICALRSLRGDFKSATPFASGLAR